MEQIKLIAPLGILSCLQQIVKSKEFKGSLTELNTDSFSNDKSVKFMLDLANKIDLNSDNTEFTATRQAFNSDSDEVLQGFADQEMHIDA